ncbi:MAG TPA: hypothetical protein VH394_16900 [Thermoanaerobaculia bacterium]|jgi:hypothetical protein|nr:hypothetical protein [Thermoanaerobaculia bacterium]
MKTYKIRVTGDILETVAATRRVNVSGQVLTFGREAVYLRAHELPSELADDRHLRVEVLPADTAVPPGSAVIDLKSERLQEPEADILPEPPPGDEIDLKSERVQEPEADVLPEPPPDSEIDLKSERVQEPEADILPEPPPGDETDLKSERVQESTVAPAAAAAARKRR